SSEHRRERHVSHRGKWREKTCRGSEPVKQTARLRRLDQLVRNTVEAEQESSRTRVILTVHFPCLLFYFSLRRLFGPISLLEASLCLFVCVVDVWPRQHLFVLGQRIFTLT